MGSPWQGWGLPRFAQLGEEKKESDTVAERILIVKVKRTSQTQAELYGARHKFADLRLFDLAELAAVGLDPTGLVIGQETPARFWAVYELSDKANKAGNPYKDIVALEPMGTPATTTSAAVSDPAILGELRAIRALLTAIAEAQGLTVPTHQEQEQAEENGREQAESLAAVFPKFGDGTAVPDAALDYYQAHVKAEGREPANLDALRAWAKAQRQNGKH